MENSIKAEPVGLFSKEYSVADVFPVVGLCPLQTTKVSGPCDRLFRQSRDRLRLIFTPALGYAAPRGSRTNTTTARAAHSSAPRVCQKHTTFEINVTSTIVRMDAQKNYSLFLTSA